jgi:hypothetical protein
LAQLDPSNCLGGQLIEGDHGQCEMLLFRVFDFVVADAVEALDEHHDGGDAEAGDFGCVVERAGGEAMWNGAGLRDGFVSKRNAVEISSLTHRIDFAHES